MGLLFYSEHDPRGGGVHILADSTKVGDSTAYGKADYGMLLIIAAKRLNQQTVSPHLQDRGRPAGFKDWLASTVCFFLCCCGCCRPDTAQATSNPPQRDGSPKKPGNRKPSAAAASTPESINSDGFGLTHDESLKKLAAAAQGAKKDDIEVNA